MNKYNWLLALFLAVFSNLKTTAQTVDGETMEVLEARLKADTSLYNRIGERFLAGDATLTNRDLSTIYYGAALRSGYNPMQEERILDAMNSLGRRDRYAEALSLCDNFLKKNPASLAAWLERGYTSWLMEDSVGTVETYRKYYQLLDIPLQSGTGESFEQAFVVASLRDVELIVDKLGFVVVKTPSLVTKDGQRYQIVNCEKEGDKTMKPTYYFNVDLPSRGMQQSLKKQ